MIDWEPWLRALGVFLLAAINLSLGFYQGRKWEQGEQAVRSERCLLPGAAGMNHRGRLAPKDYVRGDGPMGTPRRVHVCEEEPCPWCERDRLARQYVPPPPRIVDARARSARLHDL